MSGRGLICIKQHFTLVLNMCIQISQVAAIRHALLTNSLSDYSMNTSGGTPSAKGISIPAAYGGGSRIAGTSRVCATAGTTRTSARTSCVVWQSLHTRSFMEIGYINHFKSPSKKLIILPYKKRFNYLRPGFSVYVTISVVSPANSPRNNAFLCWGPRNAGRRLLYLYSSEYLFVGT